ncbi:penicillin-binding protein [Microbispora sp. RL4-1S]|uniref:Penicillin-binding protein n=1 Tax=Microbispora oryzae TaxID=2806554 RepID=A0A941AI05_9ACTN|nr:transglycosylase domain-containing protein [Microbispora oryzae]MBP2704651.1 penicillin-binding protein [Microbispora oryzae]
MGAGGRPGDERTQAMGMPAGMPPGGRRRDPGDQDTEMAPAGGRRRRAEPGRGRRGRGPGGPGGPGGPDGPGGPGGPGGPRDFDDDDEPRRSWTRFIPNWKIFVASGVVLVAGVFGMIMVAYNNTPLPTEQEAQETAIAQGSTFYYRDGQVIARLGTKRVAIKIDQVPKYVQDAVIAAENRTFWEDSGIDISGLGRSVWMTATGQQTQGGSTITQQMVRNYFKGLSTEQTIKRKVKEIFISVKLDKDWSKEKVLEFYLNTVPFGRNTYGIEAAAREFFNKPASKLTVSEGAYLAGRIQQPGNFDKAEDNKDFKPTEERFNYVINGMSTMVDANGKPKYPDIKATAKFPKPKPKKEAEEFGGLKGYMLTVALGELAKQHNLSRADVESGGYKIVTTFDKKLMLAAQAAVKATTNSMSKEFHAGLASVDPTNGRVLAFYGGDNYLHDPWNEPFDSRKQAASAFKPYVLAAWLDAGYSLNSWVPGNETVPKELPGTTKITNDEHVPTAIDVTYATAHSINTAFASMAFALPGKIDDVRALAAKAGISEKAIAEDKDGVNGEHGHGYQLAIGSIGVTPVEQAAGYSIFANQGRHVDYHVIQEVRQGKTVVYPEQREVKQVISPEAAADAVTALEQVLKVGTAAGRGIGRPAAGKTGTNNDNKEAWFVGFTPQLSTAVGMYREQCLTKSGKLVQPKYANCPEKPNPESTKYGPNNPYSHSKEVSLGNIQGADAPTTIWRTFMMAALQGKPVKEFPPKSGLGSPQDIVPSPSPTPSPTPTDEFPPGFPPDFPGGPGAGDPGQGGPGPGGCVPGDLSCDSSGGLQLGDGAADPNGGQPPMGDFAPNSVAVTPPESKP